MNTVTGFGQPLDTSELFAGEMLATRLSRRGRVVWLAVAGELDAFTAPKLRRALREAGVAAGEDLVLDLRGLRFMDSSGLAVVLAAHERAIRDGGEPMRLCIRGSAPIESMFETIGATDHLNLIEDASELGTPAGA